MKFFAFLFSLYILTVAAVPCSDKDDCKHDSAAASWSAIEDHSSHTDDTENCTPMCACACCGQTCLAPYVSAELHFISPLCSSTPSFYTPSSFSEVSLSIWQPPKIS